MSEALQKERVNYGAGPSTRAVSSRLNWIRRNALAPVVIAPLMPTYNSPISRRPWPGVMNVTPEQIYERTPRTTRMWTDETVDGGWAGLGCARQTDYHLPDLIYSSLAGVT